MPKPSFWSAVGRAVASQVLSIISVVIGAILLIVVLNTVAANPYPPGMHRWILLVFGSLAAAGLSAIVTGTLKVDGKAPNLNISATGSFAVFIVCMWVGNSWTTSSQYIALSAEEISERFTGKTMVYNTGTHEYHGPNDKVEIFRSQEALPDSERHQIGEWIVASDGTRGIILYSYDKGGVSKRTCTSSILHNAANNSYITHEINGTCGRGGFYLKDGNTANIRGDKWRASRGKLLIAKDIVALLSDKTIKYKSGTQEYHGPDGELDIKRSDGRREHGVWRAQDRNGQGFISYTYQRDQGEVVTCIANIRRKVGNAEPELVPVYGSCKSANLNIVEGNTLEHQT